MHAADDVVSACRRITVPAESPPRLG